jgi:hypothetical protein
MACDNIYARLNEKISDYIFESVCDEQILVLSL